MKCHMLPTKAIDHSCYITDGSNDVMQWKNSLQTQSLWTEYKAILPLFKTALFPLLGEVTLLVYITNMFCLHLSAQVPFGQRPTGLAGLLMFMANSNITIPTLLILFQTLSLLAWFHPVWTQWSKAPHLIAAIKLLHQYAAPLAHSFWTLLVRTGKGRRRPGCYWLSSVRTEKTECIKNHFSLPFCSGQIYILYITLL